MSTEQERAAFEALAKEQGWELDKYPGSVGAYVEPDTAAAWLAYRAALAAAPQVPEAVPQWHGPAERLVKWQHCMSYNDSYFGEPAGYLKQCVNELRHLLPPHELKAAAPGAPQPAGQAPLDVCTDPYNCKRCAAPQWDKHKFEHAGLTSAAGVKEPANA